MLWTNTGKLGAALPVRIWKTGVSTAKIRLPGYPGRRLPDGAVHGRGADRVTDRGGQPSRLPALIFAASDSEAAAFIAIVRSWWRWRVIVS